MNYFLVGMPGSGKSTIGKELAGILKKHFIDLDEWIERSEGKTIPEIFESNGQDYFRARETAALEEIIQNQSAALVSTGGGAPCFNNNMAIINKAGVSIFIDVSVEELFRRLKLGKQNRPLVQGLSDGQLLEKLLRMHEERVPFYKLSKFVLQGDNLSAKDILKTLKIKP